MCVCMSESMCHYWENGRGICMCVLCVCVNHYINLHVYTHTHTRPFPDPHTWNPLIALLCVFNRDKSNELSNGNICISYSHPHTHTPTHPPPPHTHTHTCPPYVPEKPTHPCSKRTHHPITPSLPLCIPSSGAFFSATGQCLNCARYSETNCLL